MRPRNPWFSSLLYILVPGLGQFYNGQVKKAIALFCLPFIVALAFGTSDLLINQVGIILYFIIFLSLPIYGVSDAFINARRRKSYNLKSFNRWQYYLLIIVVFWSTSFFGFQLNDLSRIQNFTIPTPAMEGTLLTGDRITAGYNRFNTVINRNDVVVFHVPGIRENNFGEFDSSKWVNYPIHLKTNYIKRCIGVPGDVIEIKNNRLVINQQAAKIPTGLRFRYLVKSKAIINDLNLKSIGLSKDDYLNQGYDSDQSVTYDMYLTAEQLKKLKAFPYISSVEGKTYSGGMHCFPFSKYTESWTGENYGPLTIPKKGMKIAINDSTLSIYGTTITGFDLNSDAKVENGKLILNGKEVSEYTFNQDYFFMMGDNRDNSLDSRYWGFVPEDHIVGKGFFIWLSIDKYGSFLNKIRWKRFFKLID